MFVTLVFCYTSHSRLNLAGRNLDAQDVNGEINIVKIYLRKKNYCSNLVQGQVDFIPQQSRRSLPWAFVRHDMKRYHTQNSFYSKL